MKVILKQNMQGLGSLGAVVEVKSGYARNFLVPRGFALYNNKHNAAHFETIRAELEAKEIERSNDAMLLKKSILEQDLHFAMKISEDGKLYGSISEKDIIALLEKSGIHIKDKQVQLPMGKIRSLGEFSVNFSLGYDLDFSHQVEVSEA